MSKSIPLRLLLSVELKTILEEVVKQKLPALSYLKLLKFTEYLQAKTTEMQKVYQKLKDQAPDSDPLQDKEFKDMLELTAEFEALPQVLFENVELTFTQSQFVSLLVD